MEHISNRHEALKTNRYLQISVIDASAMAIVNSVDQLLEIFPRVVLLKPPARSDFVEKFATGDKLHHYVYLCLAGHHLVHPNNVGVPDELHGGDLALYLQKAYIIKTRTRDQTKVRSQI